jgi:hypothetical protein
MEKSGQLHSPVALPPGKEPRYPLDRRQVGPQFKKSSTVTTWCILAFFKDAIATAEYNTELNARMIVYMMSRQGCEKVVVAYSTVLSPRETKKS